jgi:hypothetical protein
MKKRFLAIFAFCAIASFVAPVPATAIAAEFSVKLPYAKGESFVLSQGYNSPPTHIKKDAYALDFTQNGCDAYGKTIVAAASGTVMFASEEGYNGGYGTELIIDHGNNIVSRYAHMIPNSIAPALDDRIRQGEVVGRLGDTGLVAGAACADHPGTHLHFAMDTVDAGGTFNAYDPEPISGYTGMTEERWYLSDNGEDDVGTTASADTAIGADAVIAPSAGNQGNDGKILGAYDASASGTNSAVDGAATITTTTTIIAATPAVEATTAIAATTTTTTANVIAPAIINNSVPTGGVSITNSNSVSASTSSPVSASVPTLVNDSSGTNNATSTTDSSSTTVITTTTTETASTSISTTSTISITSVTSPTSTTSSTPAASSTPLDDSSATTTTSTTAIATSSAGTTSGTASGPVLFEQLADAANSPASWYSDNWFDLGDGFGGTLSTLTLKGRVSDPDYYASHVWLQEFRDPNYATMIQQFTISDNAPFTNTMATATFSGLSIPLKPYFYYRLATLQDYQNRSVILAGTTSTAIGVVMWDNFIGGIGGLQSTSTFFPYMIMEGPAATSTQSPPPLTPPAKLAVNFDPSGMRLNLSFSTSTNPDWSADPLSYEMNYSTSTSLSDEGWASLAPIPVSVGNSYLIGVRARDAFGAVSAAATTTWNFPAGFSPYILSPDLNYATQYFDVPATSTLESIELYTANLKINVTYTNFVWCRLSLYDSYKQVPYGITSSDNTVYSYDCAGNPVFSFGASALVLSPGHHYQWIFQTKSADPNIGSTVQFYGTAINSAGGLFSDPSLANARFIVNGDSGVLFAN